MDPTVELREVKGEPAMERLGLAKATRFSSTRLATYAFVLVLGAVSLLPGLGNASKLSYHEAFVGQGAREILESGRWGYATIGGRPWLEKPPLPWWLAASVSWCVGGVSETTSRLPSALAALFLTLAVTLLASRHFGITVGALAGSIQATTTWAVTRGRLAEADILLACALTWTLLAFDRLRSNPSRESGRWVLRGWLFVFFGLLGMTSLIKGIGFGAALIVAIVAAVLIWDRDRESTFRLRSPTGWAFAAAIALAWPLAMIAAHGMGALELWTSHVTDRMAARPEQFAGESWWEYVSGILIQGLPWTPLAFAGAWRSLGRAVRGRSGAEGTSFDRLLWAWGVVPLFLLSLATIRNAHYAIYAQVPWSIWGALGLSKLAERLQGRGWQPTRLRRSVAVMLLAIAMAWGLGTWSIGPWLDRRGVEWAFYEDAGRQLSPG
jgi:4-amino-4-deoxy-L-arabinose transferase-like glycosyltransferase